MFIVFYGSDSIGVRTKAHTFLREQVPPEVSLSVIDEDTYQSQAISDAVTTVSLFAPSQWYLIDTPSTNEAFESEVRTCLGELASSQNNFVIVETTLLADAKKAYSKHAHSIEEIKSEAVAKFNLFSLTDAFTRRDKKSLWMLLHDARTAGNRDEEIIGVLWWQLKALRLAKITRSAEAAGMKAYPYQKSKQALASFAEGELERLSQSLLEVYHDGHSGVRDMDVALEEWLLKG